MPNRSVDSLFQLIHSLQKGQKRYFKFYVKRNSSNEDLKMIHLFDAIDKMTDYDKGFLQKRITSIKKPHLSNIKAHLYRQILTSLRLLRNDENIDIQLSSWIMLSKMKMLTVEEEVFRFLRNRFAPASKELQKNLPPCWNG